MSGVPCASSIAITEYYCQGTASQSLLFKLQVNKTLLAITRTSRFIALELVVWKSHRTRLSAHQKKSWSQAAKKVSWEYKVSWLWSLSVLKAMGIFDDKAATYVETQGIFQAPEKNMLLSKDRIYIPAEPHSNLASVSGLVFWKMSSEWHFLVLATSLHVSHFYRSW